VSGESMEMKKMVVARTNIIEAMVKLIINFQDNNEAVRKGLLANIIWCTSNLCRAPKNFMKE